MSSRSQAADDRDVRDDDAVDLDAEPQRRADVGNLAGQHLGAAHLDGAVIGELVEPDRARQVGESDREVRRRHEDVERLTESDPVLLARAVDVQLGSRLECRGEEWETLHVIPVQVTQQHAGPEGAVLGLGQSEEAESGAEVEQDRVAVVGGDRYAGGITSVALVGIARTRSRAPNAVERHLQ